MRHGEAAAVIEVVKYSYWRQQGGLLSARQLLRGVARGAERAV